MRKQPIKRNGYYYGAHTRAGFLRMQRMGIPQPPFRLENRLTKQLSSVYKKALLKLFKDFLAQTRAVITKDGAMVQDGVLEDLLSYFENQKKNEDAAARIRKRMQVGSAAENLRRQWEQEEDVPDMSEFMDDYLQEDTEEFFKKFNADASDELMRIIDNFSIDKQALFDRNMENLRALYLDNTKERINNGLSWQKRVFLEKLNDYVEGKSDVLDIAGAMDGLSKSAETMARFFARDQMARFNKALTLSTFISAGVTKIKWVTSHDSRVRDTHRALDGRIFDIRDLPSEIDDYNCRCGLVPVEYRD
jgi:SPP1 gp7 family putative phage head morphogenesis protein